MIENTSPEDIDIIAVQEPHIDFNGLSRGGNGWRMVYPNGHDRNRKETQAILLVSTRVSSNAWAKISVNSSDIVAIIIATSDCDLVLFNIYNDCEHSDSMKILDEAMHETLRT